MEEVRFVVVSSPDMVFFFLFLLSSFGGLLLYSIAAPEKQLELSCLVRLWCTTSIVRSLWQVEGCRWGTSQEREKGGTRSYPNGMYIQRRKNNDNDDRLLS